MRRQSLKALYFCVLLLITKNNYSQNSSHIFPVRAIDTAEVHLYKDCMTFFNMSLYLCNFDWITFIPNLQDTIITSFECKFRFNDITDSCVVSDIKICHAMTNFRKSDLSVNLIDILLYKLQLSDIFYVKHSDIDLKVSMFIHLPLKLIPVK
jgi:hypothetical protein